MSIRGLQRVVVYLCWPIAPSYTSSNARGRGGGGCGVSANEYGCVQYITWHGSPNKLWRSTSIFNLCCPVSMLRHKSASEDDVFRHSSVFSRHKTAAKSRIYTEYTEERMGRVANLDQTYKIIKLTILLFPFSSAHPLTGSRMVGPVWSRSNMIKPLLPSRLPISWTFGSALTSLLYHPEPSSRFAWKRDSGLV